MEGRGQRAEGRGQALVTSWQSDEVVCVWVLRLEMGATGELGGLRCLGLSQAGPPPW